MVVSHICGVYFSLCQFYELLIKNIRMFRLGNCMWWGWFWVSPILTLQAAYKKAISISHVQRLEDLEPLNPWAISCYMCVCFKTWKWYTHIPSYIVWMSKKVNFTNNKMPLSPKSRIMMSLYMFKILNTHYTRVLNWL